jgi:Leu/Phe-tRNA-protein transferase
LTYRITNSGHIFVLPGDDLDNVIDYIIESDYEEEVVVSDSFDPHFVASLMYSGFLVMSIRVEDEDEVGSKEVILLPKHHITRTVLFFDKLHIGRTVKRYLRQRRSCYELRAGDDSDYDEVVRQCVKVHGDAWLTEELLNAMKTIRTYSRRGIDFPAMPFSFALYENGKLVAGEFGVVCGRVYTSYSGYYEKSDCGRVQMILTAEYLRGNNFAFWDLGMPIPYKYTLGAQDINIKEFVPLFRAARVK